MRFASAEAIQCPICLLEPPVAPHIYSCGHVLCLSCESAANCIRRERAHQPGARISTRQPGSVLAVQTPLSLSCVAAPVGAHLCFSRQRRVALTWVAGALRFHAASDESGSACRCPLCSVPVDISELRAVCLASVSAVKAGTAPVTFTKLVRAAARSIRLS